MDRQDDTLVIEWYLIPDPDFSVHQVLIDAIYAAHPPLAGFLGKVIKSIGKGISKFVKGVGRVVKGIVSSPIFQVLAPIGIGLLTGGTLGIPALSGTLTKLGLPGAGIIAKAGGIAAMVSNYVGDVGGLLPTGLSSALASGLGAIRGSVMDWVGPLYEKFKPLVEKWAGHFAPVVERIRKVLGPFEKLIPADVGTAGLGAAWADKRITGEIMADILKAPPEFGLMTDPSLTVYLEELHELRRVVPPAPPVSMPDYDPGRMAPPIHQLWKTVTGIPKIIPTLEGVWNSIKDIWATVKDSMIALVNWLKVNLQETLNLIERSIVDISRLLPTAVNLLTVKIWELYRSLWEFVSQKALWLGSQLRAWGTYVVESFWKTWGGLREFVLEFLREAGEALRKVGASVYQGVYAFGTWFYGEISRLASSLWKGITWVGKIVDAVFTQYLPYYLEWFWTQIWSLDKRATNAVLTTVTTEAKGAWTYIEEHFKNYAYVAQSAIESQLRQYAPMTPEKAPGAGAGLLGVAIAFGMGAHTLSTVAELAHPLKEMGVHYLSAFMANVGSFGTIAASTMGVLVAFSLRRPMGYYVNALFRPTQPRQMDLMIMAVKPDISMETFRKGMAYEGYSEEWINRFQATMFNEPRHFELSFMMEDASASPDWLFTKARRAGYTPADAEVFVRGLLAKVTRNQRVDLYRQAFNSFKEGYLTRGQFTSYLDALEMRPEARTYAVASAELAYRYDYIQDMVRLLTDTYVAGLMSEEDFEISIYSLGVEDRKARLVIQKARIRFLPKVMRAEKKEAEKAMRGAQTKLQNLYREQYRKELITEEQYHGYLVAMGMEPRLADLTVELEAARGYEVPVDKEAAEREKVERKIQKEMVTKYEELYRRELISYETFVGYLTLCGIDPDLAIAMAETEKVKALPKA